MQNRPAEIFTSGGGIYKERRLADQRNYCIKNSDAKYDTGYKCLVNMLFHMVVGILRITCASG